jgi:RND superfamily putative drug exporter
MTVKDDTSGGRGLTGSLAELALRRPWTILVAGALALFALAPLGFTAYNALTPYEFEDRETESAQATNRIEAASGIRGDLPLMILLDASPESPEGRARIEEVAAELGAIEGVAEVSTPLAGPQVERAPLVSEDGNRVYLLPRVETGGDDAEMLDAVEGAIGGDPDIVLGGSIFADEQVSTQGEEDLQRAELFAFPLLFVLSLLFFRGLVAASLPLLLGAINLIGTLVVLRLLHIPFDIGVLSINVATALGFGLAIDYSLFIVSRFREELAAGHDTADAIRRTMATAGRTVMYSSLTVAAAFSAMLVFPQNFLYSMGVSGIATALLAAFGGLVALPALLAVLGERVNALAPARLQRSRRTIDLPDREGPWYRLARWVMRHPVPIAVVSSLALLALAYPLAGVDSAADDASILPIERSSKEVEHTITSDFPPGELDTILVQLTPTEDSVLDDYVSRLRRVPGVAAVTEPELAGPGVGQIGVVSEIGRYTPEAEQLVRDIRDVKAPVPVRVGGISAADLDELESVTDRLPLAGLLLVTTTLVLLFAMTGSLVLPLKALVMNVLSLSAALGIMVWIFQSGHFDRVFDFRTDGIQIGILVLVFFAGFGLSTDYGVFTFSRMREIRRSGADNEEAVALGLERTGRIVTSAALLFAVAMGALISADLIGVQETGTGVAMAVLIDASLVRMFLVPALMALLGDRNWWSPRVLKPFARWAE